MRPLLFKLSECPPLQDIELDQQDLVELQRIVLYAEELAEIVKTKSDRTAKFSMDQTAERLLFFIEAFVDELSRKRKTIPGVGRRCFAPELENQA